MDMIEEINQSQEENSEEFGADTSRSFSIQYSATNNQQPAFSIQQFKQTEPNPTLKNPVLLSSFPTTMEPANTSKDLLKLEQKNPSFSSLESTLMLCKKDSSSQTPKEKSSSGKLVTSSVPKSQVLGKLKDFLGVMAEANTRLQHDVKEKSRMDYDIEAFTGNETDYIEMDLVLGVADLHNPEAVAAAESAMSGTQVIPLAASCCSESDTESSDDNGNGHDKTCCSNMLGKSTPDKEVLNNGPPKKRKKIIEVL